MKQSCIILLIPLMFACIVTVSFAQQTPPKIQWAKCHGGSNTDVALSIAHTKDHGFVVCGESNSVDGEVLLHHGSTSTFDYWIVKLNDTGTIEWQQSLGGSGDDIANDVKQTFDGGYVIAGSSRSNDGNVQAHHGTTDSADYWIVRLDAAGKIKWSRSFGGTGEDQAYSIDQTSDSGFIVAGLSSSKNGDVTGNHGGFDDWIIKLDALGNLKWQRSLGGSEDDGAYSIRQTSDHGFVVAGYSMSSDGDVTINQNAEDYWVVKLDSAGNILWQHSYGGSGDDVAYGVSPTSDKGCIVAGYSNSINGDVEGNHGQEDYWVVKLDSTGHFQWDRSLGGSGIDEADPVIQTSDGNFVVAGFSSSNDGNVTGNHGDFDYWIAKLDSLGVLLWQRSYGGSGADLAYSLDTTDDGGFVLAGSTSSSDGDVKGHLSFEDFWIVKLGFQGMVGDPITQNSNEPSLCFPNPFVDHTTIKFLNAINSDATFIIYNILGVNVREAAVFAGSTQMELDRDDLAGGAYKYRIIAAGETLESGSFIVQ